MKIVMGADAYGYEVKEALKKYLKDKGIVVDDMGVFASDEDTPYYQIAAEVAERVSNGQVERGLLTCGISVFLEIQPLFQQPF